MTKKLIHTRTIVGGRHPTANSCHMWREGGPLLTALAEGKNPVQLDI